MMENIKNIAITDPSQPITSKYAKIVRMSFTQNDEPRNWDVVVVMDSVCVLLYHETKRSFLFVKQFRPAVFHKQRQLLPDATEEEVVSASYTYELCAGLVDKQKPDVEIAREEVLEECGFDVPLDRFEKITSVFMNTGKSAGKTTMYFCSLDDSMKVNEGGGILGEECIEVVYVDVDKCREWMMDDNLPRPISLLYAVEWFMSNKYRE